MGYDTMQRHKTQSNIIKTKFSRYKIQNIPGSGNTKYKIRNTKQSHQNQVQEAAKAPPSFPHLHSLPFLLQVPILSWMIGSSKDDDSLKVLLKLRGPPDSKKIKNKNKTQAATRLKFLAIY